ncbi:hypothetical protein [Desulfatitalea alkaliphila]|uniref:Uncharacterized protein n=1 Tax=Desulfatitalea alkaliphila TaxID=2929485 RepID=A0AA41UR27_9BACT|nr:hypothetical protein [Desulfatitalea alkaliphila]MCJ8501943.1 hypothetical protein [Desulfatitalea alkaliphila]
MTKLPTPAAATMGVVGDLGAYHFDDVGAFVGTRRVLFYLNVFQVLKA